MLNLVAETLQTHCRIDATRSKMQTQQPILCMQSADLSYVDLRKVAHLPSSYYFFYPLIMHTTPAIHSIFKSCFSQKMSYKITWIDNKASLKGRQVLSKVYNESSRQVVAYQVSLVVHHCLFVTCRASHCPEGNRVVQASVALTRRNTDGSFFSYGFAPFISGTSIFVSWLVILLFVRPSFSVLGKVFQETFRQMWGALLVGVFIFGLAYVFNYSGMGASLAFGFAQVGPAFILLAPILGWIGVALSGSNTSTNSLFGLVQVQVGRLLGFPVLLLPSLNSVGAEVGKPVAPQTASVGVSTTKFVRNEGQVIRHNMGWTLVLLGYLIIVGLIYYFLFPGLMR